MPSGLAVLRADGPILTKYMRTFGAKLGLAFHFEALGAFVPEKGGVQPMYFTNVNAARGELPMQIINLLPPAQTLRQGRKDVRDQFSYSFLAHGGTAPQRILCCFPPVLRGCRRDGA